MLPTLTELIFCPGKQAGKQAIWNTVCVQHKDRPLRLIPKLWQHAMYKYQPGDEDEYAIPKPGKNNWQFLEVKEHDTFGDRKIQPCRKVVSRMRMLSVMVCVHSIGYSSGGNCPAVISYTHSSTEQSRGNLLLWYLRTKDCPSD